MLEMTLKAFEDFLLKMVAKKTYRKVLYPLPTLQQRIECTVCQKLKNVRIHYSGMYYFAHTFGCILHKFSIYSTLQISTIPKCILQTTTCSAMLGIAFCKVHK